MSLAYAIRHSINLSGGGGQVSTFLAYWTLPRAERRGLYSNQPAPQRKGDAQPTGTHWLTRRTRQTHH